MTTRKGRFLCLIKSEELRTEVSAVSTRAGHPNRHSRAEPAPEKSGAGIHPLFTMLRCAARAAYAVETWRLEHLPVLRIAERTQPLPGLKERLPCLVCEPVETDHTGLDATGTLRSCSRLSIRSSISCRAGWPRSMRSSHPATAGVPAKASRICPGNSGLDAG